MDKKLLEKFVELNISYEPENLCMDGMASQAHIRRETKKLDAKWKVLEKELGRKTTNEEIWDLHIASRSA